MSINVIITLVTAFAVVVFSLFNADVVTLNLIGLKKVSLPMSFLVFFVFVTGAVFAGILAIQMQIEQAMTIRRLKKKLKDLKEAQSVETSSENQDARETGNNGKTLFDANPVAGNTKKIPAAMSQSKIAPPAPKSRTPGTTNDPDNSVVFEKGDLSDEKEEDEDEGGLSSKLRDIALRRIQNG